MENRRQRYTRPTRDHEISACSPPREISFNGSTGRGGEDSRGSKRNRPYSPLREELLLSSKKRHVFPNLCSMKREKIPNSLSRITPPPSPVFLQFYSRTRSLALYRNLISSRIFSFFFFFREFLLKHNRKGIRGGVSR